MDVQITQLKKKKQKMGKIETLIGLKLDYYYELVITHDIR